MNQLDSTVTVVAGPSIQADVGGGAALIQWLSAGYTLSFAVLLITGGRLGDIYGRRQMFLLGAIGFTVASIACGIADTPGQLIGARIVQGAFGALLIPQGLGIVRAVFPPSELGGAFGFFAPVMGLASVSGPLLAGGLIGADLFGTGWRMVFLVNAPIGVVAVLGALIVLPRGEQRHPVRLDLVGVALVTLAAVLVIFPLVEGRSLGWPVWTWGMLAAGVLAFGVFAGYERRTNRAPLIEPSLLQNRTYLSGLAVAVAFFAVVAGQSLVLSLYTQSVLHFSAIEAALSLLPLSVGIAGAGFLANRLTARYGRRVIHGGLVVTVVGLVLLAALIELSATAAMIWMFVPPVAIIGIGMGLVFGPLFRTILVGINDREVGSASGALTAVQQFSGALGIAGIATLYFALTAGSPTPEAGMAVTLLVMAVIAAGAFLLAFLLPRGGSQPAS